MGNRKRSIIQVGITGAAGNIGTTLVEGLSDKYTLILFDNRRIKQEFSRLFKSAKVDLSEAEQVKGIFKGLDAIIHLAADPGARTSWENALTKNIVATYNVFEEARQAGVIKIVFASTNHVQHGYTMGKTLATSEPSYVERRGHVKLNDPPAPDSLYGVSKLFGEDLGRYYAQKFGMQFVALRIGATFPEDDPSIWKGRYREDFMRAMFLSKRDCVEVFTRALQLDVDYLVAYAISNNERRVFDLTETRERLGFNPKDSAETYF